MPQNPSDLVVGDDSSGDEDEWVEGESKYNPQNETLERRSVGTPRRPPRRSEDVGLEGDIAPDGVQTEAAETQAEVSESPDVAPLVGSPRARQPESPDVAPLVGSPRARQPEPPGVTTPIGASVMSRATLPSPSPAAQVVAGEPPTPQTPEQRTAEQPGPASLIETAGRESPERAPVGPDAGQTATVQGSQPPQPESQIRIAPGRMMGQIEPAEPEGIGEEPDRSDFSELNERVQRMETYLKRTGERV